MCEHMHSVPIPHSKNNVLPTIVGSVINPGTFSILYLLLRICKWKQKRQNFAEEAEEQNKLLNKSRKLKSSDKNYV